MGQESSQLEIKRILGQNSIIARLKLTKINVVIDCIYHRGKKKLKGCFNTGFIKRRSLTSHTENCSRELEDLKEHNKYCLGQGIGTPVIVVDGVVRHLLPDLAGYAGQHNHGPSDGEQAKLGGATWGHPGLCLGDVLVLDPFLCPIHAEKDV